MKEMSACKHYYNNWVWPHLDNTYLNCNNTKSEDNAVLRRYLFNIMRLEKISEYLEWMPETQVKLFMNILHKRHESMNYKWDLSFLISLIKQCKTDIALI